MPAMTRPGALFLLFLRLGLRSFGGPIAHLAYFRDEFVQRRGWFSEPQFAQLLALCQALPGPASSQLGFAIGLLRGGYAGGLAAFLGFTLPSALLMAGLAGLALEGGLPAAAGLVHGLKLVAVVVVAHGVVGMARALLQDASRIVIALLSLALLLWMPQAWMPLLVIAGGGLIGWRACRGQALPAGDLPPVPGRRLAPFLLGLCAIGLVLALAWPAGPAPDLGSLAAAFYQAGALVFGGGHVVLPLLEGSTVATGWLDRDAFLAGYGAAQVVPGPMFSFAAYLGVLAPTGQAAWLGGGVALLALFLPGLLLVAGALPLWNALARRPGAGAVLAGVNAAVVGLLAAAFVGTVAPAGLAGIGDVFVAGGALALLWARRWNLIAVAGLVVAATLALRSFA